MKTIKNKMVHQGYPGHTPVGVSMTIQGDTLPLRNILLRFANGILTPKGEAMFGDVEDDEHESADYNQVMNADLVEQQEMLEDRLAFIEVIKAKVKENKEGKKPKVENRPESHVE